MGDKRRERKPKPKPDVAPEVRPLAESLSSDQMLAAGACRTIAFAKNVNGRMFAKEFLLDSEQEPSLRDQKAAVLDICQGLADTGRCNRKNGYKRERGKIFAVISGSIRVAAFEEGNVIFLTHHFVKQSNQWPNGEFRRANTIRDQQLSELGRRP